MAIFKQRAAILSLLLSTFAPSSEAFGSHRTKLKINTANMPTGPTVVTANTIATATTAIATDTGTDTATGTDTDTATNTAIIDSGDNKLAVTDDTTTTTTTDGSGTGAYCIHMTGSASWGCSISGGGFNGNCNKGGKVCSAGVAVGTGGGIIKLTAPGGGAIGTQIECFFPTQGANSGGSHPANCDISLVNGYNYNVHCTGGIAFGWTGKTLWKGTTSPFGCSGGGAQLTGDVCDNTNGGKLSSASQAPPFFQPVDKEPGVYVAANQPGPQVTISPVTASGAQITCTVSGGIPTGGSKKREVVEDEVAVLSPRVVATGGDVGRRRRGAHLGHKARGHAIGLGDIVGGVKG